MMEIARKLYIRIYLELVGQEVKFTEESFKMDPETIQNFLYIFQTQWNIFRMKISRKLYIFSYLKPVVWVVNLTWNIFCILYYWQIIYEYYARVLCIKSLKGIGTGIYNGTYTAIYSAIYAGIPMKIWNFNVSCTEGICRSYAPIYRPLTEKCRKRKIFNFTLNFGNFTIFTFKNSYFLENC